MRSATRRRQRSESEEAELDRELEARKRDERRLRNEHQRNERIRYLLQQQEEFNSIEENDKDQEEDISASYFDSQFYPYDQKASLLEAFVEGELNTYDDDIYTSPADMNGQVGASCNADDTASTDMTACQGGSINGTHDMAVGVDTNTQDLECDDQELKKIIQETLIEVYGSEVTHGRSSSSSVNDGLISTEYETSSLQQPSATDPTASSSPDTGTRDQPSFPAPHDYIEELEFHHDVDIDVESQPTRSWPIGDTLEIHNSERLETVTACNSTVRNIGVQVNVQELRKFNPQGPLARGKGTAIFALGDNSLVGFHRKVPRIGRTHTYECKPIYNKRVGDLGVILTTTVRRRLESTTSTRAHESEVENKGHMWKTYTARGGWCSVEDDTAKEILMEIQKERIVRATVRWTKKYYWYKIQSDTWDGVMQWRSYAAIEDAEEDADSDVEMSCYMDDSSPEPNEVEP
ncbi:hypothetical protein BJ508DRAFT_322187 [Ascobolus immersus RN42]|uniref:Uncharacterized protein n=1 Tax=Ascobolus immersus RN42 TaxID=1160509 RepID=A0A3N4IP85_ASCIM|nr:hypothetical protein BJ508DRAFT_322187 [Ascobolus immersus RN42]